MTVYADILVIVNLYVDYFLLRCVRSFLRLEAPGKRLVAGALAGALGSMLCLLPLPRWSGPLCAGLCTLGAAAAAFLPMSLRRFLRCWLCLWLFSFLLAGFVLFAAQFAPAGYAAVVGGAVYLNLDLPLLFFATCGAYLVFWLFRRAFPRESDLPRLCKLSITHQGQTAEVYAKADTGNALREPFSGLPVVVCQREALGGLALPAWEKDAPAVPGLRLVPFDSVGGSGLLAAVQPEKVVALPTGQALDCYIALYDRPLSSGQFAAIFNPDLFPD